MRMKVPPWLMAAGLPLLLVVLAVPSRPAQKPGKQAPAAEAGVEELVWPLPPAVPRVRWVGQIIDLDEFRGKKKKKLSWFDRLAGVKPPDEQSLRLLRPYGIAVDSQGRIYVADSFQRSVFVLDPAERRVVRRGGSAQAALAVPIGVALDETDRLFVSDSFYHAISCFDSEGKALAQFGSDELERPGGIALDRVRHRLYVADAKANRVAVFNTETFAFERSIGGPSTPGVDEPGRFSAPTNVAVDRDGKLYVTDTWNHRVQIFDRRGRFLRTFGSHGIRAGNFVRPKGLAVDWEGHIYVADSEFNNFQIFTPEGQPLMAVGSLGSAPGQFSLLTGIFIDDQNRIYTTEQEGGRIQIFQYLSQPDSMAQKEVKPNPN